MARRKKAAPVLDWDEIFRLRCRSKRGESLTDEERALTQAAYDADPERYAGLEPDVFDATVPFGSTRKWKR